MAYNGYLLKVGDYIVSAKKFIKADSYKCSAKVQDLDSFRDANGELQRNVLEHVPLKIEFETPAMLTHMDFEELMSNLRKNFQTGNAERRASVTAYVPEYGTYVTQDMYMPDIEPTMYGNYGGIIHYDPIRLAFIGY